MVDTHAEEHHEGLQRRDPCHCAGGELAQLVGLVVFLEDSDAWVVHSISIMLDFG
jgi:hypothetical protein